jgi:hypothetical protein
MPVSGVGEPVISAELRRAKWGGLVVSPKRSPPGRTLAVGPPPKTPCRRRSFERGSASSRVRRSSPSRLGEIPKHRRNRGTCETRPRSAGESPRSLLGSATPDATVGMPSDQRAVQVAPERLGFIPAARRPHEKEWQDRSLTTERRAYPSRLAVGLEVLAPALASAGPRKPDEAGRPRPHLATSPRAGARGSPCSKSYPCPRAPGAGASRGSEPARDRLGGPGMRWRRRRGFGVAGFGDLHGRIFAVAVQIRVRAPLGIGRAGLGLRAGPICCLIEPSWGNPAAGTDQTAKRPQATKDEQHGHRRPWAGASQPMTSPTRASRIAAIANETSPLSDPAMGSTSLTP